MGVQFTKYCLEIFEPSSPNAVLESFESNTPFNSVHAGDFINQWSMPHPTNRFSRQIRVVRVEHILNTVGNVLIHKTMIDTENVQEEKNTITNKNASNNPVGLWNGEGGHA